MLMIKNAKGFMIAYAERDGRRWTVSRFPVRGDGGAVALPRHFSREEVSVIQAWASKQKDGMPTYEVWTKTFIKRSI